MSIPTAEEFMNNQGFSVEQLQNLPWFDYGNLLTWLEEYSIIKAKLHVEKIKNLQESKYYAGETGYILKEEWNEILTNIK